MRQLKIHPLYVAYNFLPVYSGPSWYLARRLQFLAEGGLNSEVITARQKIISDSPLHEKNESVSIHRIPILSSSWRNRSSLIVQLLQKTSQLLREDSILHVLGASDEFTLIPMFVAYCKRIPIVVELQLVGDDDPSAIMKRKFGWLRFRLMKRAQAIIAISRVQQELCIKAGIHQDKVHLVPVGADITKFRPVRNEDEKSEIRRKLNLPLKSTVLVSSGRVSERKGVHFLVECLAQLVKKHHDTVLLWVGPLSKDPSDTTDEFIKSLLRRIENEQLASHVIFTGHVVHDDVAEYFRASDMFVFASDREGLGVVQIEALASGLPSVVTYLPGITEDLFQDGRDGFVLLGRDVDMFCDRLTRLIGSSELRRHLSQNARVKAESCFDELRLMARYIEIYGKLRTVGCP